MSSPPSYIVCGRTGGLAGGRTERINAGGTITRAPAKNVHLDNLWGRLLHPQGGKVSL